MDATWRNAIRWLAGIWSIAALILVTVSLVGALFPPHPWAWNADGARVVEVCGDAYGGCVTLVGGAGIVASVLAAVGAGLGLVGALRGQRMLLAASALLALVAWIPLTLAEDGWRWSRAGEIALVGLALVFAGIMALASASTPVPRRKAAL